MAKFWFLGDFNDHKPDLILQLSPQLRQVVHYRTCGQNILDLCITDAHQLYHPPLPEPSLLPDDPSSASPSDHLGNLLVPRSDHSISITRAHKLITVRPITESQMNAIGKLIVNQTWDNVTDITDVDTALDTLTSTISCILDNVAPTKKVKISCEDPAWMNLSLIHI